MEHLDVLLFDVDGVLVDPLAYKVGIVESVRFLCKEIGIKNSSELLPSSSDIAFMESCGIHDVWDMTNIMFALIIRSIFESQVGVGGLSPLPFFCTSTFPIETAPRNDSNSNRIAAFNSGISAEIAPLLSDGSNEIRPPDYKAFAASLSDASNFKSNIVPSHPPDAALELLLNDKALASIPLASIHEYKSLLMNFLASTRSVLGSYGTRIFQNIILGTSDFEKTYELSNKYHGDSLLKTADKPALNEYARSQLLELQTNNKFAMAVYTARPSLPPTDQSPLVGYSPEAEIALQLVGMSALPLVGMGMMEWLASKYGKRTEDLTKPNTTHSVAALFAAIYRRSDSEILERAYRADKMSDNEEFKFLTNKHLNIHVFEDTISGIKPLQSLAERLRSLGYSMKVTALGIAKDESKKSALAPLCLQVFDNVNDALEFVLSEHLKT